MEESDEYSYTWSKFVNIGEVIKASLRSQEIVFDTDSFWILPSLNPQTVFSTRLILQYSWVN